MDYVMRLRWIFKIESERFPCDAQAGKRQSEQQQGKNWNESDSGSHLGIKFSSFLKAHYTDVIDSYTKPKAHIQYNCICTYTRKRLLFHVPRTVEQQSFVKIALPA
jgi:hypothetical protein